MLAPWRTVDGGGANGNAMYIRVLAFHYSPIYPYCSIPRHALRTDHASSLRRREKKWEKFELHPTHCLSLPPVSLAIAAMSSTTTSPAAAASSFASPPHVETSAVEVEVERDPTTTQSRLEKDALRADVAAEEVLENVTPAASSRPPTLPHNLERAQEAFQSGTILPPTDYPILRLSNVRLVGSTAVRPSFLARLCRPYMDPEASSSRLQRLLHSSAGRLDFPPPEAPTTLPGILALTARLGDDLQRLDVFSGIDASLMPSLDPLSPQTATEDVDVLIQLKEAPRFFLKSSTDVGNGEGSVSVQGRVRNLFGGAEKLEGSYEMGTRTKMALNANFTTPILASPDHAFTLATYLSERDKTFYASSSETARGLRAAVTANDTRSSAQHELAWELTWRHLLPSSPMASIAMRQQCGHHIKSSLTHTYMRDTRDDLIAASEGALLKSTTELAPSLLGGDTNFIKWEGETSTSRQMERILPGWSWSVGARSGLIAALGVDGDGGATQSRYRVPFSDKFQLGGPTCVRMFKLNGLGPKDERDSLGGTAFWSLGASIFGPIPQKPTWPLKLHAFWNAGQLGHLTPSTLTQPSTSAGFGLMYTQGPLRLELNTGMPLTARKRDGLSKGFQIGIGISFLS